MQHSQVSASSAERWFNCPGSVREVALCPVPVASEYAIEGTVAHRMAETCLRENKSPFSFVGERDMDVLLTDEMAEAVQLYLDVIDDDLAKYKLTRQDLDIERKFHLTKIHPDAYGTCDAILPVFLTKVIVYDFKYGSGIAVDAEDNKQGMYYALGAAQEGDYDEFEIVIVQPRAIHKQGPVRRWTVSKHDLQEFAEELKVRIKYTQVEDAYLKCGEWCKKTFCAALSTCKEARKQMENAAMVVFDAVPVAQPPSPDSLTPLMLRRLLDMAPIIDAYLKAVEARALELANKGEKVPGYKLVARRSNRKWKDEEVVVKKFGKEVATKTIVEVLSPSQLETKLKETMKLKEAKATVEPLAFKPDTGNVLVPENDPRQEATPQLEHTFADESLFG